MRTANTKSWSSTNVIVATATENTTTTAAINKDKRTEIA